jgi:NADH-quinone oxidoreductase subunit H
MEPTTATFVLPTKAQLLSPAFHLMKAQELWASLPDLVVYLLAGIFVFALCALMGQVAAVFMILMERKVLAWFTQRKGPNRVGPAGIVQSVADGIKLLLKEDIMTPAQDKFLFTLAPAIFLFPMFALYALVPFSQSLIGVSLPLGLMALFALSSVSVVGLVLAGWSSNNKFSLLGGMRSAAQAISYEVPLILSVLGVVLFAGSGNLNTIIQAQSGGIHTWYAIMLSPLSFLLFYIASIAEVNRVPFDLPEAESELVSGYNTEYSGMKFATFFLAEYAALFVFSALTVALFFGGYTSPIGGTLADKFGYAQFIANALSLPALKGLMINAEQVFWMLSKSYVFIYLAMLLRGTLPRLKPDQLMGFCWKFLIPLALINLFMLAFAKQFTLSLQADGFSGSWVYLAISLIIAVFGIGGFIKFTDTQFKANVAARYKA